MTRVDFYFGADDKITVACRIAAKALRQKLRVLIYSPSEQTLARVSHALWSTPPTGFTPHCRVHEPIAGDTPVLLVRDLSEPPLGDVLINLDAERPSAFARYERLVEIVGTDEADRASARERFKFYRDRGYEQKTHDLGERGT